MPIINYIFFSVFGILPAIVLFGGFLWVIAERKEERNVNDT